MVEGSVVGSLFSRKFTSALGLGLGVETPTDKHLLDHKNDIKNTGAGMHAEEP